MHRRAEIQLRVHDAESRSDLVKEFVRRTEVAREIGPHPVVLRALPREDQRDFDRVPSSFRMRAILGIAQTADRAAAPASPRSQSRSPPAARIDLRPDHSLRLLATEPPILDGESACRAAVTYYYNFVPYWYAQLYLYCSLGHVKDVSRFVSRSVASIRGIAWAQADAGQATTTGPASLNITPPRDHGSPRLTTDRPACGLIRGSDDAEAHRGRRMDARAVAFMSSASPATTLQLRCLRQDPMTALRRGRCR